MTNGRHEIEPNKDKNPNYCDHLLVGQYILVNGGYVKQRRAWFTNRIRCTGVGG